jgi:hypothetical protein
VIAVNSPVHLNRQAKPIVDLPQTAFHHGIDMQLPADVPDIHALALELERRRACYHAKRGNVGERVGQLFGNAIG